GLLISPSVPLITHSSPCLLGAIWFHSEGITLAWRHYISCCYLYLEQKQAFEFGFYVLLLSPVICSIMAFLRSLQVEEMALTSKSRKYGFVAWLVSTSVGLSLSFLSKSSVLLGISLTVPLMVACLSIAVPIWMHNGYQFWFPQLCGDQARDPRFPRLKGFLLWICVVVFVGSVMALGAIISSKPKLGFRPISGFPVVLRFRPGLVLLFGAIAAVIIVIRPWTVSVKLLTQFSKFLAELHPSDSSFVFQLKQTSSVCFLAFLLGLVAFLVGWFQDKAFAGASVGYFTFLFLLAGRALAVLLSPPIVVYSPRVLPVYVYDAHADCGKNVSAAFLVLYGIALATEGWGVVASLIVYPPFAGAAVSAITLVVSFGFAVTPEYNEEGIYTVRFCIQGEWVSVVIDDWIPCE
ncbi:unnamed protein product, partial [Brassica oleracea var. botrytis]